MCQRCIIIECDGSPTQHADSFVNPPSKTRRVGQRIRYTGWWCECCFKRLWDAVNPDTQKFLLSLAGLPEQWVSTELTPIEIQQASLDIANKIRLIGIGVSFPDGTKQPKLATASWKWGLPYAFDETTRSWKEFYMTSKAAFMAKTYSN